MAFLHPDDHGPRSEGRKEGGRKERERAPPPRPTLAIPFMAAAARRKAAAAVPEWREGSGTTYEKISFIIHHCPWHNLELSSTSKKNLCNAYSSHLYPRSEASLDGLALECETAPREATGGRARATVAKFMWPSRLVRRAPPSLGEGRRGERLSALFAWRPLSKSGAGPVTSVTENEVMNTEAKRITL